MYETHPENFRVTLEDFENAEGALLDCSACAFHNALRKAIVEETKIKPKYVETHYEVFEIFDEENNTCHTVDCSQNLKEFHQMMVTEGTQRCGWPFFHEAKVKIVVKEGFKTLDGYSTYENIKYKAYLVEADFDVLPTEIGINIDKGV